MFDCNLSWVIICCIFPYNCTNPIFFPKNFISCILNTTQQFTSNSPKFHNLSLATTSLPTFHQTSLHTNTTTCFLHISDHQHRQLRFCPRATSTSSSNIPFSINKHATPVQEKRRRAKRARGCREGGANRETHC